MLFLTTVAQAQQPAPRAISLASFAPDDVVFYAEFDKLDRLEGEVSGADAWDLVRGFIGEASGGDWRAALSEHLSFDADEAILRFVETGCAVGGDAAYLYRRLCRAGLCFVREVGEVGQVPP